MHPARLAEIAAAVDGQLHAVSSEHLWMGRVQIDSREIQPGDLFLALPGSQRDGHEFVTDAIARGALLAIVRRDQASAMTGPKLLVTDAQTALQNLAKWHRHRMETLVIGVTGSVGKTTTRELIHQVLQGQHPGIRSRKNFNNEIGLPLSLLEIQPQHEFAILEFGAARIGDVALLAALSTPEIGVITAIGEAHLRTFGSVEGILQGKGELLDALPPQGFAVLPGDCPKLRAVSQRANCRVIFVGEGVENSLRATITESTHTGLRFQFDGHRYHLPMIGRHNLTNALCALAIGREIGIPHSQLAESLADFEPVAGRSSVRHIGSWTVIDDTYNASPLAFHAAVKTLMEYPLASHRRRFVIAGDMLELGTSARNEHRRLGETIGQSGIDRLLVTGDHADDVAAGALSGGMSSHHIAAAQDWDLLLFLLECWLEPEDVLLVKGSRGLRMERVIDWLHSIAHGSSEPLRRSA